MNKKYFIALIVVGFLVASVSYAHGVDLGIEPGILPTSSFYFVKEWRRAIQLVFTFDAVKKADLELNILNEKAAEAQKISEADAQNIEAVKSALQNYIEAHSRLVNRLNTLKETSQNPNVDKLLDKLVEKTAKHESLFEDIAKEFNDKDEIKKLTKSAKDNLDEVVSLASEKDDAKKFAERLKKEAEKEIDDKEDATEKSAEQIKEAEEKINKLSANIAKEGVPAEKAKGMLNQAKERLAAAKKAFGEKKYGEAFGQARSAEFLARNGMKMFEAEKEIAGKEEDEDENKGGDNKNKEKVVATNVIVVIDENGNFSPFEVKIKKGGQVTWVNKSSHRVWPASAAHPTHLEYPGFDSLKGLDTGESYSFVFEKTGSWKYHNHLNPGMRGEVKVVE